MNISVEGGRTSITDWEAVRTLPASELPPLTAEQRIVAKKLGIVEADYARSALAGQRTTEKLFDKTERFGRYFKRALSRKSQQGLVESITLNTWDGKFEITVREAGRLIHLCVDEAIVDDYFDSGSPDMEERLSRILDLTLEPQVS
ncbi:MAG: hypothetical protein ABSG32_19190 [Terriglobia bacterium]